jgi:hypothetical protein
MSGNDLPISGLSRPSSGDDVIGCSLHAADRLFPPVRYFSAAYRRAIDYPSPGTIGYELMSPILSIPTLKPRACFSRNSMRFG